MRRSQAGRRGADAVGQYIPGILECVEAYATLGEGSHVFGVYTPRP